MSFLRFTMTVAIIMIVFTFYFLTLYFRQCLKVFDPSPQVRDGFCKGCIAGRCSWCVSHSLPYWSRAVHVSLGANLAVNWSPKRFQWRFVTPMYVFQIRGPPAGSGRPSGSKHTVTERSTVVFWSTQRPRVFHSWSERWAWSCALSVWFEKCSQVSSLHCVSEGNIYTGTVDGKLWRISNDSLTFITQMGRNIPECGKPLVQFSFMWLDEYVSAFAGKTQRPVCPAAITH